MNPNAQPDDRENLAKWLRIAEALELLEKIAREETDPSRQDLLYAQLGEAKCMS